MTGAGVPGEATRLYRGVPLLITTWRTARLLARHIHVYKLIPVYWSRTVDRSDHSNKHSFHDSTRTLFSHDKVQRHDTRCPPRCR